MTSSPVEGTPEQTSYDMQTTIDYFVGKLAANPDMPMMVFPSAVADAVAHMREAANRVASPLPTTPSVMVVATDPKMGYTLEAKMRHQAHLQSQLDAYCNGHDIPTPLVLLATEGETFTSATLDESHLEQLLEGQRQDSPALKTDATDPAPAVNFATDHVHDFNDDGRCTWPPCKVVRFIDWMPAHLENHGERRVSILDHGKPLGESTDPTTIDEASPAQAVVADLMGALEKSVADARANRHGGMK